MTGPCVLFATCSKGIEDLLAQECAQSGFTHVEADQGGVHLTGTLKQAYHLCLWSRLASRVLLQLSRFSPQDYDGLYQAVQDIDWSEHMSLNNSFAIDCFTAHAELNNSHYATLRIKDAIADQFKDKHGERPDVAREQPDVRINAYIGKQTSMLYLDLSGEPLHKRGYRQRGGEAPLRESLAAAILMRCKWPAFAEQGKALFDPMCGSGTLLIEAAYMAANIAPGILRTYYGFLGWKQHQPEIWAELTSQAQVDSGKLNAGQLKLPPILGADSSASAINIARQNIKAAHLDQIIKLYELDSVQTLPDALNVNEVQASEAQGLVVTNPPYGKRLGQVQQLKTLYYRLGESFKQNFQGWSIAVFSSSHELIKCMGLRAHHKNTLYNGALKCTLYQFKIGEHAPKTAAAQSSLDETSNKPQSVQAVTRDEHAEMFFNRLKKNVKHLAKWARKNNISCYRIYDADMPEYSVAIDVYEDWAHIQEYEPPKDVDSVKALRRLDDVVQTTIQLLQIPQNHIVVKTRKKQTGSDQYTRQDDKNRLLTVHENGLKFKINLYDYLDTGLFLDHRNTRELVRKYANKKSFLNLFAYTGAVSVYAAAGGARSTTTVDMSNTYLEWAQDNMHLNGYRGKQHQFERADCMQWIWDAKRAGHRYQLIFLDPPTFSNSKKMQATLDIRRDHVELINLTMRLLEKDGMLIFSTNAKRFKLDEDALQDYVIKDITYLTSTEDFKRKPAHKCWCLSYQAVL